MPTPCTYQGTIVYHDSDEDPRVCIRMQKQSMKCAVYHDDADRMYAARAQMPPRAKKRSPAKEDAANDTAEEESKADAPAASPSKGGDGNKAKRARLKDKSEADGAVAPSAEPPADDTTAPSSSDGGKKKLARAGSSVKLEAVGP